MVLGRCGLCGVKKGLDERIDEDVFWWFSHVGGQEKRKDSKLRKSRNEEKVVGFSSASVFPTRKREAVTQGGTI